MPIFYPGPIPDALRNFHLDNPHIRQSASTLSGQVNPEERSQYYIGIQRNFLREVYQVEDFNIWITGNLSELQEYLKTNYDRKRHENNAAEDVKQDEKEYEDICYSFMFDLPREKQEAFIEVVKYKGRNPHLPKTPQTFRSRF